MPRLRDAVLPPHRAAFDFARPLASFDRDPRAAKLERNRGIIASADLRPRRSRLRSWRRRMADCDDRRAISRFRRRHRRGLARLFASSPRRSPDRAGRQALAHVELVSDPAGGAPRRAALRSELRRLCVLHQFRRRGRRRLNQDRAQISVGERASGKIPYRHLQGRIPRAHHRHHLGSRKPEISRWLRSSARRLRHGRVRRSRSRQGA